MSDFRICSSQVALVVNSLPVRQKPKRCMFDLGVGKTPWRRKWQPTPVSLPRKSHGQRSLVGYSPWDGRRVGHDLVTKQQQETLANRLKDSSHKLGGKSDSFVEWKSREECV